MTSSSAPNFGILGSGFGLYGHLPVVYSSGSNTIYLLESSIQAMSYREDLSAYVKHVKPQANIESLIEAVDYLVISLPPENQFATIYDNINLFKRHNVRLILEKPLAISPDLAINLSKLLQANNIPFWVNYTFLYTAWFNQLLESISFTDSIDIKWHFKAHHFKYKLTNWKVDHEIGGGPVRFYGIHLFACIAHISKINSLLQFDLSYFRNYMSGFKLSTLLENNMTVNITIDTNCDDDTFQVYTNRDTLLYSSKSPFESDLKHVYQILIIS